MFYGCSNFNQPLGNWDVSNVSDMRWMFNWCDKFNQDISNWDVSNVVNMRYVDIATSFVRYNFPKEFKPNFNLV